MEEEEEREMVSFWGKVVPAGKKITLPMIDGYYTFLNSACLGEISSRDKSILKATVETILIDDTDEATSEAPTKKDEVIVASLIPNVCEQARVEMTFSPLNTVTFEVEGPNDVHLTGGYDTLSDDDEEEEEEEELNEKRIVEKLMELGEREEEKQSK